jgi:hypothetical protein
VFAKDNKKEIWRQTIESSLKQMDKELKSHRLAKAKQRHPAYKNQVPQYEERESMHEMATLTGGDAFKPRDSFRSLKANSVNMASIDLSTLANMSNTTSSGSGGGGGNGGGKLTKVNESMSDKSKPISSKIDTNSPQLKGVTHTLGNMLSQQFAKRGSTTSEKKGEKLEDDGL